MYPSDKDIQTFWHDGPIEKSIRLEDICKIFCHGLVTKEEVIGLSTTLNNDYTLTTKELTFIVSFSETGSTVYIFKPGKKYGGILWKITSGNNAKSK